MANENSDDSRSSGRSYGFPITRLYRAHIQPNHWRGIERTAFVEASTHTMAIRKIAAAVAALEFGSTANQVQERIYNVSSGIELVAEGLSLDHGVRLFETGWGGQEAICFVEHPLFLLSDPAPLWRKWAQIPQRRQVDINGTSSATDIVD